MGIRDDFKGYNTVSQKRAEANKKARQFKAENPEISRQSDENYKKYHYDEVAVENDAETRYCEHYKERHGQLKVSCVGMQSPISIDDVYIAVQFLEQRAGSKYSSPEDIEQAFREEREGCPILCSGERQDSMRAVNDKQYLMVLGGPGVGKSTFLRKVGIEALKGKDGNFEHECIPIFLELKRFTEDMIDVEALIIRELEVCGYPYPEEIAKVALESGKLLILFDGLDEVPTANINNVVREIGDFVDQYSRNRFIASSRIAAYSGGFTRFTDVEMADFDDLQVEKYINNWFTSIVGRHGDQFDTGMKAADQCWKALNAPEHQATRALARNSLLLTFLCMIYNDAQNFPRKRAVLYEKVLDIFLKKWPVEKRVYRDLSVSQYLDISTVKKMLSKIAAKNFEADRLFFTENELIDQIEEFNKEHVDTPPMFGPSQILNTILVDPGIFVERVSGFYSFSHLTFQEYLTANHFVKTQSIQGLVTDHLYDDRWREVFLFIAELMPETDSLLVEMEAESVKSINTPRLKKLFGWVKRIANTSDNLYDGVAKRTFAILQYFSLWLFSKIYEVVKDDVNPDFGPNLDFHLDLNLDPDFDDDFYNELYLDFYQSIYLNLDLDLCLYLYKDLNIDLDFYLDFYRGINLDIDLNLDLFLEINLYLYLCGYMEIYFYSRIPSESMDRFEAELDVRVTVVKRIEQAKIFKDVDLQRMVRRFNIQREFVKAAREGNFVKPPRKSIHNTWLSVLHITDDMLAISRREVESCLQYLSAVELIVTCKESARYVSEKIWQKIEDRLLAWEGEKIED